eukprot:TRINITY_DN3212_c0_g2_i3.p1 TRINITY_DN3212_c0_g2~~TRINITY_DN3212_c0_g2_i3.p1  ORF type:complete len:508 (+),score=110.30 TRINITY_DN3212_c0_g2_i3:47-1525(+)
MGAHDFCAEMLRSKARCALIVLLTGGLCWITVILVIDFRDQRQSVTRSEVVTLASQTPPWLALFSNPVFAGTCYVSAVKCTFFETPEELISSAAETEDDILSHQVALMRSRSKDCTAALHLLSPFCSSAHACTVEELCGEATSCPQQLFVGYYFNTTTAAALGATFRGAGRQQMTLEVTTAADCMPLSAMRVLTVYAFNGRVHSNGEPVLDVQRLMESTKLALDGSLADDLDQVALYMRMWGSPSYVDTRSAANVLFRYTDRIDLDGNVDRHVQMETSQIRTSLPCKDRTDSDACGSVTPAQCQADDGTALRCPARCGLCRTDAAQHKVLLSVRPLSMTKVVHTEQRGQRALELFGHIFDFAGVMMAGSVLGVFDTVLLALGPAPAGPLRRGTAVGGTAAPPQQAPIVNATATTKSLRRSSCRLGPAWKASAGCRRSSCRRRWSFWTSRGRLPTSAPAPTRRCCSRCQLAAVLSARKRPAAHRCLSARAARR